MGHRLGALILVCALFIPQQSYALAETSSVAEDYRVAAELWKGHAQVERARRRAAEEDAADARRLAEAWRDAAKSAATPKTPDWVWPSVAATVVVSFVLGFIVAWRVPPPEG